MKPKSPAEPKLADQKTAQTSTKARPVAKPTAEPKARKLTAKERRVASRGPAPLAKTETLPGFVTYGSHEEPEADSPKVANAKRVLDAMSESLAPEGALPAAPSTPLRMDSEPSKVCSYHKRPEALTAFASNAAHADHLQSACREAEKIRRDARKAKAAK